MKFPQPFANRKGRMTHLRSWRPSDKLPRNLLTPVISLWDSLHILANWWRVAEALTEEELQEKDELIAQGFEDWSRRDFQQFVRALESYGWSVGLGLYMKFNLISVTGPKILICYHQKFRIRQRKMSPRITPCSGRSGKNSQVSGLF